MNNISGSSSIRTIFGKYLFCGREGIEREQQLLLAEGGIYEAAIESTLKEFKKAQPD